MRKYLSMASGSNAETGRTLINPISVEPGNSSQGTPISEHAETVDDFIRMLRSAAEKPAPRLEGKSQLAIQHIRRRREKPALLPTDASLELILESTSESALKPKPIKSGLSTRSTDDPYIKTIGGKPFRTNILSPLIDQTPEDMRRVLAQGAESGNISKTDQATSERMAIGASRDITMTDKEIAALRLKLYPVVPPPPPEKFKAYKPEDPVAYDAQLKDFLIRLRGIRKEATARERKQAREEARRAREKARRPDVIAKWNKNVAEARRKLIKSKSAKLPPKVTPDGAKADEINEFELIIRPTLEPAKKTSVENEILKAVMEDQRVNPASRRILFGRN
jgi:hypothetical protein